MDIVIALKKFSAGVIQVEKLSPPVQIKLMDVGMNAVYEMECSEIVEGLHHFTKERLVPGTMAQPGPYTVEFTADGKTFRRDFPG